MVLKELLRLFREEEENENEKEKEEDGDNSFQNKDAFIHVFPEQKKLPDFVVVQEDVGTVVVKEEEVVMEED